eukprot:4315253-Pyramimonas_sp.AAC.1
MLIKLLHIDHMLIEHLVFDGAGADPVLRGARGGHAVRSGGLRQGEAGRDLLLQGSRGGA